MSSFYNLFQVNSILTIRWKYLTKVNLVGLKVNMIGKWCSYYI